MQLKHCFLDAKEEIQEVLLSQGQILSALKIAQDSASPRKFLQAAQSSEDPILYHSTLHYFRSNPQFATNFTKGNVKHLKIRW